MTHIHEIVQEFRCSANESISEIIISDEDDDDEIIVIESNDHHSLDFPDKNSFPDSACNGTTDLTDSVHIPFSSNRVENNSKTSNNEMTESFLEEIDEKALLDGITDDLDRSSDVEFDEDFLWEDDITKIFPNDQSTKNNLTKLEVSSSKFSGNATISSAKSDKTASNQADDKNGGIVQIKEIETTNGRKSNSMEFNNNGNGQCESSSTKPIDNDSIESFNKKNVQATNQKPIDGMSTQQLELESKEMSRGSVKKNSLTDEILEKDNTHDCALHSTKNGNKDDDSDVGKIKQLKTNKRSASPAEIRKTKIFICNAQAKSNNLSESLEKGNNIAAAAAAATKKSSENVSNKKESNIKVPDTCNSGTVEGIKKLTSNVPPTSDPPTQKTISPSKFSLNFVRKFQKDILEMNRNDLEELMIQKCVETIVYRSEYAHMRSKIVAQEKKMQDYSMKYQELRKQFIDLQIVLHRVIDDLKVRNENAVPAHKVTRAVGLQVSMPRKKKPSNQFSNGKKITKGNNSSLSSQTSNLSPDTIERPQSTPVIFRIPIQTVSAKSLSAPNSVSATTAKVCTNQSKSSNISISLSSATTSLAAIKRSINLVDQHSEQVTSNHNSTIVQPLPPLPHSTNQPTNPHWKQIPPQAKIIEIVNNETGIFISWNMEEITDEHTKVVGYQIYTHKEALAGSPPEDWRLVGNVKAMLLPMAVTLSNFEVGQRYHFSVRAIDKHGRNGILSLPKTWR